MKKSLALSERLYDYDKDNHEDNSDNISGKYKKTTDISAILFR